MPFKRSSSIEFPSVWSSFEGRQTPSDGRSAKYRIQDIPEEWFDECVEILLEHFINDEPPSKHIEMRKYPKALANIEKMWRESLSQGVSLVCVEDDQTGAGGRPKIVGLNVLSVVCVQDKDGKFETDDPIWRTCFGAVTLVANAVDVFKKYGVEQYLSAMGLVVKPEYRGQHIAMELLKARIPLARALGMKVTATVFTALASQRVAAKCGFVELADVSYDEMASQHDLVFPGINTSTKSSKLMAMEIPGAQLRN